jgi:hypothetical protein
VCGVSGWSGTSLAAKERGWDGLPRRVFRPCSAAVSTAVLESGPEAKKQARGDSGVEQVAAKRRSRVRAGAQAQQRGRTWASVGQKIK